MSDELLRELAGKAGIQSIWTDQTGQSRIVAPATLRAILAALSLPCESENDMRNALSMLELGIDRAGADFVTARVGQPFALPVAASPGLAVEVEFENGALRSVSPIEGLEGTLTLPAFDEPGYHRVRVAGHEFTVATAPERCVTIGDLTDGRPAWGLGAQIYSLRQAGDGGIGHLGGVAALARAAAPHGADALAISPMHALFAANPHNYSPYSPSSRLFYNPLYADPADVFPPDLLGEAIAEAGCAPEMASLEAAALVDWERAGPVKYRLLRALYRRMTQAGQGEISADFNRFREQASPLLTLHATFEALHAAMIGGENPVWSWRDWPEALRDPAGAAVADYAREHQDEVGFHVFLQWLAGRSYASCQRVCREAGMRVGLVADLAIGMDGGGSHAWSRQDEVLTGLGIGAPPDYYNAEGQDWGLTTFSPRGLLATGFAPFIETLRASLRHAGGLRIDHVMGMNRLWLVPSGARATEGAYVTFPSESMFRLLALESWRHRAVVIGEDLGTAPDGFREQLAAQGVAGMRVMRFERSDDRYRQPDEWTPAAAGMTTTHDLVSTAGWWAGTDLDPVPAGEEEAGGSHAIRAWDRGLMWGAFQQAGVVGEGERPAPQETAPVVDAAVRFLARTPCILKVLAVEDALGVAVQPNVPGTTTEKPNWRHRLDGPAERLLENDETGRRLATLQDSASTG